MNWLNKLRSYFRVKRRYAELRDEISTTVEVSGNLFDSDKIRSYLVTSIGKSMDEGAQSFRDLGQMMDREQIYINAVSEMRRDLQRVIAAARFDCLQSERDRQLRSRYEKFCADVLREFGLPKNTDSITIKITPDRITMRSTTVSIGEDAEKVIRRMFEDDFVPRSLA